MISRGNRRRGRGLDEGFMARRIAWEQQMSFRVRAAAIIALLATAFVDRTALAQNPRIIRVEGRVVQINAKVEAAEFKPADALKPSVGGDASVAGDKKADKTAAVKKKGGEPANLEAVAAPFRALFGGVVEIDPEEGLQVNLQAADANAEIDAQMQQYIQQYRPIMKAELGFVRLMCGNLTPEQRKKIRVPADEALKLAARQMAKQQNQMGRGVEVRVNATEPHKTIRDAIRKALKETLTEEQMTHYTEESAKRTAHRKQAAIVSLVARLDAQMFLNSEQRDKISESISSKWQDNWESWLQLLTIYGDQYFPNGIDPYVTSHLNSEQKKVWQGLQKIDFQGWWGGDNGQNMDNDGWWGDAPEPNGVLNNGALIIQQLFGF